MEDLILNERTDDRLPHGYGGRFYGVYSALVTSIADPLQLGRVKIKLPWASGALGPGYSTWARVATLMAGLNRGTWFIPDVEDEVLVSFESGDPRYPYVLGSLWNGLDRPPALLGEEGLNNERIIQTGTGVKIILDDTPGQGGITLETPLGQSVTIKDGPGTIECKDTNGNIVSMDVSGITINAGAKVTVNAGMAEVNAGTFKVNAGMSMFSGVLKADTVITNSVVSTSYTPGAGNIW